MKYSVVLFFLPLLAFGADDSAPQPKALAISLPVLEAPTTFGAPDWVPSMDQALSLTAAYDLSMGFGYEWVTRDLRLFSEPALDGLLKGALFVVPYSFLMQLPPGDVWLHETFHQNILRNQGISSHNDVYDFRFASTTAVSHVTDEELADFKADDPASFVRMSSAGAEGQVLLANEIEKVMFFGANQGSSTSRILIALNLYQVWAYLQACTTDEAQDLTDELNRAEAHNIAARDFTGLDFTAWVYDLFRPGEPYSDRGPHPYGPGISRYIAPDQLTQDERAYLQLQAHLSLLSFVDYALWSPLWGQNAWRGGSEGQVDLNANLRHFLTPFGSQVDLNLFFRSGDAKGVLSLLNATNARGYFPGLRVTTLDWALSRKVFVSTDVTVWGQPRDQGFRTTDVQWGVASLVRLEYRPTSNFGTWLETSSKTAGWVAGEPSLDDDTRTRIGVAAYF